MIKYLQVKAHTGNLHELEGLLISFKFTECGSPFLSFPIKFRKGR